MGIYNKQPCSLDGLSILIQRVFHMLQDRHELHIMAADGLKELIDLESPTLRSLVDCRHGVELDSGAIEKAYSTDHLVESGVSSLVLAIAVMNILRAVYGNTHKEIMLPEKAGPFTVQKGAVCLDRIMDNLSSSVLLLKLNSLFIEVYSEYKRLASVPVESNLGDIVGSNILSYHIFEHLFGHSRLPAAIYIGLVKVVAIIAIEIA